MTASPRDPRPVALWALALVALTSGAGCDAIVGADCAPWSDPCGALCCSPGLVCSADMICVADLSVQRDAGLLDPWGRPVDGGAQDGGRWDSGAPDRDGGVVTPGDGGDGGPGDGGDTGVVGPADGGEDAGDTGVVGPADGGEDAGDTGVVGPADGGEDAGDTGVVAPADGGEDAGDTGVVGPADGGVDGGADPDTGVAPDAGDLDGGVDPDSGVDPDAGDLDAGADPDGGIDPDAGPVICPLGTQLCDELCVDTSSDDLNCGGCNVTCAAMEVCSAGVCTPTCLPPRTQCGLTCANLAADPVNCGFCGNVCGTHTCYQGGCVAPSAGHVVLIGHDMRISHPASFLLASNAVFLPVQDPLTIGRFQEASSAGAINGVNSVLVNGAAQSGRTYADIVIPPAEVTQRLADVDVFVILPQDLATDGDIMGWATDWSLALNTFVRRGGTVVVFDSGGTHNGSWQLLQAAGLFPATGRVSLATGTTLDVYALADAVARGAPLSYPAPYTTSTFTSTATEVVVHTQALPHLPVVFHRVVRP
jgi:hypothetical protein